MQTYYDMHCHVDFAPDAAALSRKAAALGLHGLSATVTPEGYLQAKTTLAACENMHPGLGLHPWWVADSTCKEASIALFEKLAPEARIIGEIGLDFAPRRAGTFDRQTAALERALRACAGHGPKTITLHAVRSASAVLDALECTGALSEHACIFHWFSGTSDELHRAAHAGCYFSMGLRALASKRGRAFARSLPLERLLLETDLPASDQDALEASEWYTLIEQTAAELALIKNMPVDELVATVNATSSRLLNPTFAPKSATMEKANRGRSIQS